MTTASGNPSADDLATLKLAQDWLVKPFPKAKITPKGIMLVAAALVRITKRLQESERKRDDALAGIASLKNIWNAEKDARSHETDKREQITQKAEALAKSLTKAEQRLARCPLLYEETLKRIEVAEARKADLIVECDTFKQAAEFHAKKAAALREALEQIAAGEYDEQSRTWNAHIWSRNIARAALAEASKKDGET